MRLCQWPETDAKKKALELEPTEVSMISPFLSTHMWLRVRACVRVCFICYFSFSVQFLAQCIGGLTANQMLPWPSSLAALTSWPADKPWAVTQRHTWNQNTYTTPSFVPTHKDETNSHARTWNYPHSVQPCLLADTCVCVCRRINAECVLLPRLIHYCGTESEAGVLSEQ